MAIMDGLRSTTADRPGPSLAALPGPKLFRALYVTRAVAAAVPELRHFVRRTAQQWAVPEKSSDTLSLVVTELVTNAVLHSGSADVTALIVFDGVAVTIEVTDSGRWLARGSNRCVAEDEDADFGRGLDLVRACTSWCMVHPYAAGTRILARLPVAESGSDR